MEESIETKIAITEAMIKLFHLKQEKKREFLRHQEKISQINDQIDAIKRSIENSNGDNECNFNKHPSKETCEGCKTGDKWNYKDWDEEIETDCPWK